MRQTKQTILAKGLASETDYLAKGLASETNRLFS